MITEGEWKIYESSNKKTMHIYVGDEGNEVIIAAVQNLDFIANAHAISAVPKLLEVGKKFKEMYIQDTDLNKQTDFYVEVCAAIAKAEPSS